MYKIIFIDEVQADIHRFERYVDQKDTEKEFEVIGEMPEENIDEFIEHILSENFDAVISDFQLSEYKSNITYTGVDLVERILQKREKFPCFVMTSHDDRAVSNSSDVNIVYIKGLMNKEDNVKITFLERIKNQIIHYQKRIHESQKEFCEIIKESKTQNLSAKKETRLLELDKILENTFNQESNIPAQLKEKSTLDDLHKMIENTDKLLKKLDDENE